MWNPLRPLTPDTAPPEPPLDMADTAVFADTGEPLVLLGHALLVHCGLDAPEALQRLGLKDIWFARYIARGQDLTNPVKGKIKHFEQSQLRLKLTPLRDAHDWRVTHEAELIQHLLQCLALTGPPDKLQLETGETCCESPCFGCMAYQDKP